MPTLKPRAKAPDLEVQTLEGDTWNLSKQKPDAFTMIVFYRGVHCPICQKYLQDLDSKVGDFSSRGVDLIAVSGDDEGRARKAKGEWDLKNVPIGYGLSTDSMRQWGLFVSNSVREGEPAQFGEPGLFLIRPDGTVYYEAINSAPFGRPQFAEVLKAVDFIKERNYPPRGEA
ncbi:MAG: redoxin domain-containing protein [Gemmatimonadetes bacterium]|nr:AhpC/TSA family protein [Gemmatimonadota bacterium]NIW75111.1 redoxin domain-containing protein [Gemmatimonadota bacterium]